MPLAAIPFKSPPAFELHPMMADPIRQGPWPEAVGRALELLVGLDAGEAMAVVRRDAAGRLAVSATHGTTAGAQAALAAWAASPPPEAATDAFVGRVLREGQPLLMMGAATPSDAAPLPEVLRGSLLAEGQLGFVYLYPIAGEAALMIHRPLPAGPLNHDQPAIAQAVADLLAGALASTPAW
ncbi:MAG: hypothetical protein VKQ33_10945 [Candidatus Sericytochromatia bacterium]|nr:hypothetical protein [Candidatus Sericytochromatia bacterium]